MTVAPNTIGEYLAALPPTAANVVSDVIDRVRSYAPDATESIRYGMPAFRFTNGHPIYIAAWKRHVSLHDIPTLPDNLEAAVARYRSGKDTLKFDYRSPVPIELIERIVEAVNTSTTETKGPRP